MSKIVFAKTVYTRIAKVEDRTVVEYADTISEYEAVRKFVTLECGCCVQVVSHFSYNVGDDWKCDRH